MTVRDKPTSCQAEPPYPDHETVIWAMCNPDWVCHFKSERCTIECPHLMSECGEFES